jgi:branched-chain amino acid transport system ATP-binding protein
LAPVIVEELLRALRRIVRQEALSAIIIEQHAKRILDMTDDAIVLERGVVVHAAQSATLRNDQATLDRFLGVTRKDDAPGPTSRTH